MRLNFRLPLLACAVSTLALAGCNGSTGPTPEPPPPKADTFDGNALDRYTIYNTPRAWTAADGYLYAGPQAVQSVVIRDSLAIENGWVETETDYAADGGLVLRHSPSGNYYLLAIRDDNVFGYANLEMYRADLGLFTTIAGPVDLEFPRGTRRRVRFEAAGSTLTAYLDGVPVLQASDPYYVSGGFGLRHDNTRNWPGMVSRFDLLRWSTY